MQEIQEIKKAMEEEIGKAKSALLFTGDKDSTLLLDIVKDMNVDIVFIDTGYHFDEIGDYVKSLGNKIKIIKNNNASIDPAVDMDRCCNQRKVEALKNYLDRVKAECLIVPFRDEERGNGIEDSYLEGIENIEIRRPLADLTERDIWVEIKEDKLPFSRIYNKGYRFVDCKCCTTRHGRKKQGRSNKEDGMDRETEERLKSLGYM